MSAVSFDGAPAPSKAFLTAGRLVASTLPGAPPASPADVDELATMASGAAPEVWSERSVVILTGLILAATRAGRVRKAVALAEEHFDDNALRRAARASAATTTALLAAVAEAYAAAGWPRRATRFASRSSVNAENSRDAPAEFRAQALLGLSRAINGEYEHAQASLLRCRELQQANGWAETEAFYPLLLAETLVASAGFDVAALQRITTTLRTVAPLDPTWQLTASATEAMGLLLTRDLNRAIPLLVSIIHSTDRGDDFSMVQGFVLGIYADLLLSRGDARRALSALENHVSPPGHALCFDMQRSAALLQLGRNREALVVTDPCLRLGADHCLRTIPPLLFRRAIAHQRLGNLAAADDSFEEAFHLITASGSATPLLTLPRDEVAELLERLQSRRPDAQAEIEEVRRRLAAVPEVDVRRSQLPALTPTEERLAASIREPLSYGEIAARSFVSLNTLKTQVQNLYRKLGVRRRADALARLEQAGFYD